MEIVKVWQHGSFYNHMSLSGNRVSDPKTLWRIDAIISCLIKLGACYVGHLRNYGYKERNSQMHASKDYKPRQLRVE